MEVQLQELIDKIKTDGVAVAEKDASEKLAAAEAQAAKIIADAKAEAEKIRAEAAEENERLVRSGEDAIRQAGRNILIQFRESVVKELDAVVKAEVDKKYSRETIGTLVPEVVKEWAKNTDASDISVLLNEADLQACEEGLLNSFKGTLAEGVTLAADDSFEGGFRIAEKSGSAYYDFSAEAVADMFAAYLNPRTAALLKEASKL